MAMHDAVDVWEALIDLAVDMALDVAWLRLLLHGFGGFDVVLDKVLWGAYQSRRHVARHPKGRGVIRRADRDVPVCVEDIVAVEDV